MRLLSPPNPSLKFTPALGPLKKTFPEMLLSLDFACMRKLDCFSQMPSSCATLLTICEAGLTQCWAVIGSGCAGGLAARRARLGGSKDEGVEEILTSREGQVAGA